MTGTLMAFSLKNGQKHDIHPIASRSVGEGTLSLLLMDTPMLRKQQKRRHSSTSKRYRVLAGGALPRIVMDVLNYGVCLV